MWNNEYCDDSVIIMNMVSSHWDCKKRKAVEYGEASTDGPLHTEDYFFLKNYVMGSLMPIIVKGIPGVAYTRVVEENGVYHVDAFREGKLKCLSEIMALPWVDHKRTTTNDIFEALQFGGIEMARQVIYNELRKSVESYNISISDKHYNIVCDVMSQRGFIMGITRHGINRIESKPLTRASFEETTEVFHESARFGLEDDLQGTTQSIVMGKLARLGTGMFSILMDPTKLESIQTNYPATPTTQPSAPLSFSSSAKRQDFPAIFNYDTPLFSDTQKNNVIPFVPSSPSRCKVLNEDNNPVGDLVHESYTSQTIPMVPSSPRKKTNV